MVKAFAYLRVSGKGQVSGDGFPRQLKAIREYAAAHDITIARVFREEGVTGTKETMDREAFAEMMTALHSNGVRTIIIEKLDRLARDLMVQEATIADLQKHSFTLVSVAEPDLMASDPTRILMRQLMGAVAQYDKSQIVLKLRGARMRMRAKEGRCEGRKPYGFYDGEEAVIERMNALRATGLGFDRIAAQLNAEGAKTRAGARWHGLVVNRILTGKGRKAAQRGGMALYKTVTFTCTN
jgi:DNA invertase Pin-like site-specific DNA recombinase